MAGDFTSRFLMRGERAYGLTPTGLGAVDLATGETLWDTPFPGRDRPPPEPALYEEGAADVPVLSHDGAQVYAATKIQVEGTGTTQDHPAVQLIAVDAGSGKVSWSTEVALPQDARWDSDTRVRVVAADAGKVVVTFPGDGFSHFGTSAAVDAGSHEVVWSVEGTAQSVINGVVLAVADPQGSGYPQMAGIDLESGSALWSGKGDSSAVTGFSAVELPSGDALVTRFPYSGASPRTHALNLANGEAGQMYRGMVLDDPHVVDGFLVDAPNGEIEVWDLRTMKLVWHLPSGNRMAPENVVSYGGHLFGRGFWL
jgi:outer membrane protein assembly factor BamB